MPLYPENAAVYSLQVDGGDIITGLSAGWAGKMVRDMIGWNGREKHIVITDQNGIYLELLREKGGTP